MMRLAVIFSVSLILASCSMLPESWNLQSTQSDVADAEVSDAGMINSSNLDFSGVDVGQSMEEVLRILGPSVQVDDGRSLTENYVKGGEIYDVLYFRGQKDGVDSLRAYLFREDRLVGIGWSSLD